MTLDTTAIMIKVQNLNKVFTLVADSTEEKIKNLLSNRPASLKSRRTWIQNAVEEDSVFLPEYPIPDN